ncbi:TetR/AcrR family transcriptional regulator [Nitratireductor mangrovi]|uniref:TetR/AcrR family transcriptional regulator n=1 Tax=Nitratireductor mangrovi TaxID=2599600 RepID=A0A5B8L497_9HYPH|nr:TetR/AcrR family transcriptional regulator [Nitratireductor mangrovi]QDZ02755.1 TetR/AcrR family transcriptional regulator [Nitratireductor mangrovi]
MAERDVPPKPAYHHGDLRNALLVAAEQELRAKGLERFTLRGCAKRAGVSHAAPAHHFADATGLLTALATEGFQRFIATQRARQAKAAPDARSQYVAAGLGYIDFALANPELFRLMFSSRRADFSEQELDRASAAAYDHLVATIGTLRGDDPRASHGRQADVTASWAIVHGLADLLLSGRIRSLDSLEGRERDNALAAIIARSLPA